MIDIRGIDKTELLAALYNRDRPLGMGMLSYRAGDMGIDEARERLGLGDDHAESLRDLAAAGSIVIRSSTYFDYLHGRVMKVDIGGDSLDPRLYDRDNGKGAAAGVVAAIRAAMGDGVRP